MSQKCTALISVWCVCVFIYLSGLARHPAQPGPAGERVPALHRASPQRQRGLLHPRVRQGAHRTGHGQELSQVTH